MVDPEAHRAQLAREAPESDAPPSVLLRPRPPRSPSERLVAWVTWFGVTRLVVTGVAVAAVAVGGFWLVRTPTPAAEATLPVVSSSAPTATLPVPTAAASGTSGASTPSTLPSAVFVHVAGEVAVPGVYRLDGGGRVHEAIERAGGATTDADLDALNLAQPLVGRTAALRAPDRRDRSRRHPRPHARWHRRRDIDHDTASVRSM